MSNFIIIPNDAFKDRDKSKKRWLSKDELYLYAWLYRRRIPDDWSLEINIDFINVFCYKFSSGNDSRNKKNIKDILISLHTKGYIETFGDIEINENLKYSDPLYIGFPTVDPIVGYNSNITYLIFDQFEEPLEFFIYAYIDCFGDKGRNISYYKWSQITNSSEKTIIKAIDKMNSYDFNPRIWKFSGDYYQTENYEVRQQENIYFTRPNEEIIKKWNGFYAKRESKEYELAFGYRGKKDSNNDVWGEEIPF